MLRTLTRHGPLAGSRHYIAEQQLFPGQLPYFTELTIGGCSGLKKMELISELIARQLILSEVVERVICQPECTLSGRRVQLYCVLVYPYELGLRAEYSLTQLSQAAHRHGLGPVPIDAALFAALQFQSGWTTDKQVVFMSQPIQFGLERHLFTLSNLKLNVVAVSPDQLITESDRAYLFAREV